MCGGMDGFTAFRASCSLSRPPPFFGLPCCETAVSLDFVSSIRPSVGYQPPVYYMGCEDSLHHLDQNNGQGLRVTV